MLKARYYLPFSLQNFYTFLVLENTINIDEYLTLYCESLTSENLIFE